MSGKIGIVYNEPVPGRLHSLGEEGAVVGVLDAVSAVRQAVQKLGYEVQTIPLRPPLSITVADLTDVKADIIFNLFEGFDGEPDSEAAVAEVLEQMGTCFTGSPSRALRLSQNKAAEKQILRSQGIPVPDWQVLSPESLSCFALNFPCIIKPLGEHASHGISADSVVADRDVLSKRIHFIFESYRCQSLVEEFLPGREFCALVVGNEHPHLFPIEEIVYTLPEGKPKILTYAAKWIIEDEYFTGTKTKCPADVSPELSQEIENLTMASFRAVSCRGYARVDMRQDKAGQLFVLEVNPNPDISSEGGARLQAEVGGLDYVSFIHEILSLAQDAFAPACGSV